MKPFQTVQEKFADVGFILPKSKSQKELVLTWLNLSLGSTASTIFLIFEAKTFQEYITSAFLASGGIVIAIVFTILAFEMEEIFKFIDSVEMLKNKSES